MEAAREGPARIPVLSHPLPLNWGRVCSLSRQIKSEDVQNTPSVGDGTFRSSSTHPASMGAEQSMSQSDSNPSFLRVPGFNQNESASVSSPDLTPSYDPPRDPALSRVSAQTGFPRSAPSYGTSRQATPATEISTQEALSYLQPLLERAIVDRLGRVVDTAAQSAANAAAERIRAEILSKIDLIVRDAVDQEIARLLRR